MATKRHTRAAVAGVAIVVFALVATWISLEISEPERVVATSPQEAEKLLDEAVRMVQADDYVGLCERLGSKSGCQMHLQEARVAGLVPSRSKPEVVEVTQVSAGEVSLRLRGNYIDGRTYEAEFHVFRAGEQLQVANAVYWLPIERVAADCVHEPGHVECGATASPPSE